MVGALNALHSYRGDPVVAEQLSREACEIEIDTLHTVLEDNDARRDGRYKLFADADLDAAVVVSVAATKPETRGRGVGTVLSWHGLEQARKVGYEICYSNWISPNLLASRFWPRFGFQDAAYRLAKKINPMIAWARIE